MSNLINPLTNAPDFQPTHGAPSYPITPRDSSSNSALQFLRDATAKYFADNGVPAVVAKVGLKYRSFQINTSEPANRVVFIPGAFDGNNKSGRPRPYGTLSKGSSNSVSVVNPRELALWERTVTVSIWAAPSPDELQAEDLALIQAENLLEQTVRALAHATEYSPDGSVQNFSIQASWSLGEVTIAAPPTESGFGVEFFLGLQLRGPLFDTTLDVVFPKVVQQKPNFVPSITAAQGQVVLEE